MHIIHYKQLYDELSAVRDFYSKCKDVDCEKLTFDSKNFLFFIFYKGIDIIGCAIYSINENEVSHFVTNKKCDESVYFYFQEKCTRWCEQQII